MSEEQPRANNRYNKKPGKRRAFNRDRYHDLREIQEAYARLFTGKGSKHDAEVVLQDLDYLLMSMKVTQNTGDLRPDPVACHWATGIMWYLNQIHNNINAGLSNPNEGDADRDEYIRGVD